MITIQELEQGSIGYLYDVQDQLKRFIYGRSERAFATGDAARDAIMTRQEVEARQQEIHRHFIESLGLLPPSDTPLEASTVGVVEGNGFRVEKVIFQSRPRHYVTANLYLPDDLREPRGAVLFLCGHHREAKHAREYQIVCQHLVQAGLIVFAQDPVGQGERPSYYERALDDTTIWWGTTEHEYAGRQCLPLGDAIARYFLHDAMRSVDYLCNRPEVDNQRIGVVGNSGGGTQTCLMMLGDPRIAAAAPTTFLMNRETYMHAGGAQDAEQIWPGFTAAGFDHEDILIAMVPRPVRVLAVTGDFFPIEGTRRTVQRCQRFWKMYDRPTGLDLVEDESTHMFTRTLARAAAEFFSRHLLRREHQPDDERIAPFEPQQLWCTRSGYVKDQFPDSVAVFEANQERLKELEEKRNHIPVVQRHERAVQWLRDKVHHDRQPTELNPRFYLRQQMEELLVQTCLWWSQEGLFNHGIALRDFSYGAQDLPVTLAVWDGGTNRLQPHLEWIRRTCRQGRAVLVLDVAGSGSLFPYSPSLHPAEGFWGVIHKLADDLIWLDDSLAALRIYDVLRALDMIERWPGMNASDIQVYAHGGEGVYGRLAAVLDQRIRRVEVADGMRSYAEWISARHYDAQNIKSIILPGMLQYFDLPEIEHDGNML